MLARAKRDGIDMDQFTIGRTFIGNPQLPWRDFFLGSASSCPRTGASFRAFLRFLKKNRSTNSWKLTKSIWVLLILHDWPHVDLCLGPLYRLRPWVTRVAQWNQTVRLECLASYLHESLGFRNGNKRSTWVFSILPSSLVGGASSILAFYYLNLGPQCSSTLGQLILLKAKGVLRE